MRDSNRLDKVAIEELLGSKNLPDSEIEKIINKMTDQIHK